jgi:hypothetical protein
MSSFSKRAEALVVAESGWDSKVAGHRSDLKSHLETLVTNCKEKLLAKLAQTA